MRLRKKSIEMWKIVKLNENDSRKKKLEIQIAKKNYEVEILKIELKYPEAKSGNGKIWFKCE